ncbi:MAG: SET domain-containing protein [bacterium]|nr:SET domain-containing protein [bacterium]
MLKVKAITKESGVHGTGLFADEDIAKGTVVWVFEPNLDISLSKETYDVLPVVQKQFFDHYAYWSDELDLYICAADGWRFTNHSKEPNTGTVGSSDGNEGQDVALRDIKKDEELLFDYRGFGEDPENIV